jgi:hypothetical protein
MVSPTEPRLTLNAFEIAILRRLAGREPSVGSVDALEVVSREFTGAGSYTTFKGDESAGGPWDRHHVGLNDLINMPGVPNGMGAVLFFRKGQPACLEVYTFGGEHWDGVHEGFSIEQTA